jgi:hypothetical protein
VSPGRYELGFYIPEDDILHSNRRGNIKSDIVICDLCTNLWSSEILSECEDYALCDSVNDVVSVQQ